MFVNLFPYKTHTYKKYTRDKSILVLDTKDGVVERVSVDDIENFGIEVRNYALTDKGTVTYDCVAFDEMLGGSQDDYIYVPEQVFGCWSFYANGTFHVFDMKANRLIVDDVQLEMYAGVLEQLVYIFRYKDYTIVRMHYDTLSQDSYYWSTVALGNNKIIYWDETYECCNDKAFAMRVDMTSEA